MERSLSEILSIYATLKVNHDSPANPPFSSSSRPKHLVLLDGIALLMVTEGSHDVAAATMTNHATKDNRTLTKFHIVKNRSCSSKEVDYLRRFIDLLNTCVPHRLQRGLWELIIPNCKDKILSRLVKLQKSVKDVQDDIANWGTPNQAHIDRFREVYKPSTTDPSWVGLLFDFLVNGLHPGRFSSQSSAKPLFQTLFFLKIDFLPYLRSPQLVRRLKKIADYAAIITRITILTIQERPRRLFELNILPSPSRAILPPILSPLHLINESAEALEPPLDHFRVKDLRGVAPSTVGESELQLGRQAVEAFVHCECALAVEMRKITMEPLEIGVSKDCCWPCMQFLKEYGKESGGITVSASHGKTYQSWLPPLDMSHEVQQRMEEMARSDFKLWLFSLNGRRKSDSQAGSTDDHISDEENDLDMLQQTIFEIDEE